MSVSKEQVVLEELLTAAIDAALKACEKADKDPFEKGLLMAYYDLITVAKEQARIVGLEWRDKRLGAFDPDKELLNYKRKRVA
jgi:hypothetical protein